MSNTFKLCCGTGRGCPTVTYNESGSFTIVDDFGGIVTLSIEEIVDLGEKVENLIEESETILPD